MMVGLLIRQNYKHVYNFYKYKVKVGRLFFLSKSLRSFILICYSISKDNATWFIYHLFIHIK